MGSIAADGQKSIAAAATTIPERAEAFSAAARPSAFDAIPCIQLDASCQPFLGFYFFQNFFQVRSTDLPSFSPLYTGILRNSTWPLLSSGCRCSFRNADTKKGNEKCSKNNKSKRFLLVGQNPESQSSNPFVTDNPSFHPCSYFLRPSRDGDDEAIQSRSILTLVITST